MADHPITFPYDRHLQQVQIGAEAVMARADFEREMHDFCHAMGYRLEKLLNAYLFFGMPCAVEVPPGALSFVDCALRALAQPDYFPAIIDIDTVRLISVNVMNAKGGDLTIEAFATPTVIWEFTPDSEGPLLSHPLVPPDHPVLPCSPQWRAVYRFSAADDEDP